MTQTLSASRALTFACCWMLAGCGGVDDDALEDNDSAATATALALTAAATPAIVVAGDDDFFTATGPEDGPHILRFELVQTGGEMAARFDLLDDNGAPRGLSDLAVEACADGGDAPPLPRVCDRGSNILRAEIAVDAGAAAEVAVRQPLLCADCFTPEASTYTLAVELAAF